MKQAIIPTIAEDVLVVEVPNQSEWEKMNETERYSVLKPLIEEMYSGDWIKNGKTYHVLGELTADTCTVDCKQVIQLNNSYTMAFSSREEMEGWRKQRDKDEREEAEQKFRSLLEANGVVFVNKYGKEQPHKYYSGALNIDDEEADYTERLKQWQQEQQRVWGKAVVILINKPEVK